MTGFEQHGQHLAPQRQGRDALEDLDFAAVGLFFVAGVGLLEFLAVLVVQIRGVGRREQGPVGAFHDTLHEQVGNPVGTVHVVGTTTVVTGVLAQFEELLDVQVPGFQVGTDGALALAALIHGHGGVVHYLEEGDHALRLAVGTLDAAVQRAHRGPVVAQAAGELLQHGVFLDALIDAIEVVGHRGQVAGGQLRMQGAGVEQGRGRRHEVEGRQHAVELDGALFALDFVDGEAHGDTHEEDLRQLDAALVNVQEIAVIQGLQAEVAELQVAAGVQRGTELGQVELGQARVEQLVLDTDTDEFREIFGVAGGHGGLRHGFAQHFLAHGVEQQTGGDVAIGRLVLDQGTRGENGGLADLFDGHAVVEILEGGLENGVGRDLCTEAGTGRLEQGIQGIHVQRTDDAVVIDVQRLNFDGRPLLLGALLVALFAVEHIGAGNVMLARTH